MGKIDEVINNINNQLLPYTPEQVKAAFNKLLLQLDYTQKEGITVTEVDVDMEGDVLVTFIDNEADFMEVVFGCADDIDNDGEEDCFAIVIGEDDDEDMLIIDLDSLDPPTVKGDFAEFIDLTDLSWLNKSTLSALFNAGDIGIDNDLKDSELIGNNEDEEVEEIFRRFKKAKKKFVVRGGKKVRQAIVVRKGRQVLSGRQKRALRKARLKASKAGAARKRMKSLKRRKSFGIKRRDRLKGERP